MLHGFCRFARTDTASGDSAIRTTNSIHIKFCYKSYKGECFQVFRSTFSFKAVCSVFTNCPSPWWLPPYVTVTGMLVPSPPRPHLPPGPYVISSYYSFCHCFLGALSALFTLLIRNTQNHQLDSLCPQQLERATRKDLEERVCCRDGSALWFRGGLRFSGPETARPGPHLFPREPGWTVRRDVLSLIDPEAAHGRGDQLAPREALEGAGELLV